MNTIKSIGLGITGGLLPLAVYLLINTQNTDNETIANHPITTPVHQANYSANSPLETTSFVDASNKSLNAVVHVTTTVETTSFQRDLFSEFFYGPGAGGKEYKQYGSGSGSGVIIDSEGYIVTNNHVIESATEIKVTLNDNEEYDAEIVGTDPSTDIAVLKIKAKNLPTINFGNSDEIQVGEWVLAVGNPFNLTSTVTAGIVSAKARNINLLRDRSNPNIIPIESFIQTDAAVNPGNSGGALVNTKGELVGINTAIASQTGSYTGYSFAVPVNLVKKVMTDLIEYGIVQRAFLGVQILDITQQLKEEKDLKTLKGIYVAGVIDNGAGKKSGIKEGNIILKIGQKDVNSVAELQEEIGKSRPGDKINVTITDDKGYVTVKEVTLRNKEGETSLISKEEIQKNTALGATFIEISSKDKKELNIANGVKIKTLSTGKLKSLGLKEGMIITKINNEPVTNVEILTDKLNRSNNGILLEIVTETGRKEYIGFGI